MNVFGVKTPIPRDRLRSAWTIAIGADLLQIAIFPIFIAGAASPFDATLDVLVALLLIWRVGWHWAFLPTFVAELLPGFDLAPTWTIAVWLATRGRHGDRGAPAGPSLPAGPR